MGGVVGGGSGVLDDLTSAIDVLLGADPRAVPLVDVVADLGLLHAQMQRLEAVMLTMVRTCDSDGGHHVAGYATTGSMLTDALRMNPGRGQAMTHHARALPEKFPRVWQALVSGEISVAHAVAIRRAEKKLPADRVEAAEPVLLQIARVGSPAMVRGAVDRMAELLQPEEHDEQVRDEFDRRNFGVSLTLDGWWAVDGHLPPQTGARLAAAIEQFASPGDDDDRRTSSQRRADAVEQLADAALGGQTAGVSSVVIVADAAHLDGRGARWDVTGLPVGASEFDLAVCQSQLTLVVAQRSGVGWKPLAVGMGSRFATPAQRAALAVRDQGCVYRGCSRPARRCHAHHVVDWRDGGPTDLDNLVLLCAYHHRMIHLGRARFIDDPDSPGRRIAIPARRHTGAAA